LNVISTRVENLIDNILIRFWPGAYRCYETSKEALNLAKESNDIYLKGFILSLHGTVCYFKGKFDKAESSLTEGLALSEKTSVLMVASLAAFFFGNICCEKGDLKKAKGYYKKAIFPLKNGGINPSWVRLFKICTAKINLRENGTGIDINTLYNYSHTNKIKVWDGWFSRLIAEILMNMEGKYKSEAEDWIKGAIELDENRGLRWNLAKDYAVYSELFKKNGDSVKAKENINKAIGIFKECGADGWVEKYEKELAAL
jgi:tetratricopeptide (TPR) repeat protein